MPAGSAVKFWPERTMAVVLAQQPAQVTGAAVTLQQLDAEEHLPLDDDGDGDGVLDNDEQLSRAMLRTMLFAPSACQSVEPVGDNVTPPLPRPADEPLPSVRKKKPLPATVVTSPETRLILWIAESELRYKLLPELSATMP